MNNAPLLELRGVGITAGDRRNRRTLVRDVDLTVAAGETVGLVGESGSGKSMLVKSAMRLLPRHAAASGRIDFEGRSVLGFSRRELSAYRSRDVALIHQDPRAHTNPLRTIGDFLVEGVVASKLLGPREARQRACALMAGIGITDPEHRLTQYPHQLSGGLLQRMMIVAALLPSPKLVFADEPTTALDVTVQSEVMAILQEQIRERNLGLLFISHDLDLAAAVTDSLAVMYAGTVVERGTTAEVYSRPLHPYTAGLLACRPSATAVTRLTPIPGRPVSAYEVASGCAFAARCPFATEECQKDRPQLRTVEDRLVACHRVEQIGAELAQVVHS
ncbi:ABC transporter ATP-binding protein [Streptomyces sp. JV178]|uniref:ABC transporter ATP-binding protein n=1 Tax=Streptomyces sp. JV178 TaxID=858632 RepID=UPI000C1B59B1|nr:ABC transporter ATP-binding protein [Streptomyces sp. JV178]PIM71238.1 ABC transporter ATP-binding protein [Streptomyces sp. JV178]